MNLKNIVDRLANFTWLDDGFVRVGPTTCTVTYAVDDPQLQVAIIDQLESDIAVLRDVVNEQADDEGLWFIAQTASEAYVQAALRRLHEVIEGKTSEECARELVPVSKKVSKWIAHPPDRKATVSGRRDK